MYNQMDKFINDLAENHGGLVRDGLATLQNLKKISYEDAEHELIITVYKAHKLNRTIAEQGQLSIGDLYKTMEEEFDSETSLKEFIKCMFPIFLYSPGKQNPRNTSDGYRKVVYQIAKNLREKREVSEENIDKLIASVLPRKAINNLQQNFAHDEFFLDFKSLRSLAAQSTCFQYDKELKCIQLTESEEIPLALMIELIRPTVIPEIDRSRTISGNAVVTRLVNGYIMARVVGAHELSGYYAKIKMEEKDNMIYPIKTYISLAGYIAPNSEHQIEVTVYGPNAIGKSLVGEQNKWGGILERELIYPTKGESKDEYQKATIQDYQKPTQEAIEPIILPDIQTLSIENEKDKLAERIKEALQTVGENAPAENILRELNNIKAKSALKYREFMEQKPVALKNGPRDKFGKPSAFIDGPEPAIFTHNFKNAKELKEYMKSNSM